MKFGIFCNNCTNTNIDAVMLIIDSMKKAGLEYSVNDALKAHVSIEGIRTFSDAASLRENADVLVTVGGDGTILSTLKYVYGSHIPVVGVNTGRLGYLTSIAPDEFESHLKEINEKKFDIEERTLLEIETSEEGIDYKKLAMNEVAVLKKDSSSMITVKATLNGEFLNTYWADGLIISTPTGSTAYSLSCGGPIIAPGSGNFIITPIAPHNLNVRPLVIPDSSEISLSFEARSSDLMLALDSYSRIISDKVSLKIKRAEKRISLLRSEDYSYLETLRSKLNWGLDKRN